MNKKNKQVIGLIVAILIAIVVFMWFGYSNTKDVPEVSPKVAELQQPKEALEEKLTAIKALEKTDPVEAKKQTESIFDALPAKLKRRYEVGFTGGVEDIAFYGQVLDQYDSPVVGARVEFEAGGRYLAGGSGRGILITDDEGRFHFKAEGGNLTVGPIVHPEIDTFKHLAVNEGHQILHRVGFLGYQHAEGDNALIWLDYTLEAPYIFRVWRISSTEYARDLHQGSLSPRFDCDGRTFTFDFTQERAKDRKIAGDAVGQIKMRYTCQENRDSRDTGDWSVEIEAVDGGIQESLDVYLNQAPIGGYAPTYKIEMQKDDSTYRDRSIKHFYFTANNGEYYGAIRARIYPYRYEKPKMFIEYKVNPSGGRSLVKR